MLNLKSKNEPVAIDLDVEEEEDQFYVTRPHTSIRRYDRPPQRDAGGSRDEAGNEDLPQKLCYIPGISSDG